MELAIDGLALSSEWGGMTTYARQIVRHLLLLAPENHYTLFVPEQQAVPFAASTNVSIKRLAARPAKINFYDWRVMWEQTLIRDALAKEPVDLYFGPTFMAPLKRPCPAVVTIHDVVFAIHPEFSPPGNLEYYGTWTPRIAQSAEGIITSSQDTKRLLTELWQIPPERITHAALAVSDLFSPLKDITRLKQLSARYKLAEGYILYVGGTFPRKNWKSLIRAYAQLPAQLRQKHKLVLLTGTSKNWGSNQVLQFFAEADLTPDLLATIVVLDFVAKEELVSFYHGAALFVYPSIYEGFGLPPLEAMACGTPVITSDAPAMNEAVAEAGILVAPLDVAGMAKAIQSVLLDPSLQAELRRKAIQRSQDFSWKKTAQATLSAFHRALA